MKRMNERIEKRMEDLGLNKNDMRSVDIAMESLEAEDYASFNRNEVSHMNPEALWLGGMDKSRKRDVGRSFGPNSHDLEAIGIRRGEDADHMDIDEMSTKHARVSGHTSEGLWLGGMDRGRKRDFTTSFGTKSPNNKGKEALSFKLNAPLYIEIDSDEDSDDVHVVGESSSRQHTRGTSGPGLGGDMDVERISRQRGQEEIRNGQDSNQRPQIQEDHIHALELLADMLAGAEFQEPNPMPIRPRPIWPPVAAPAVRADYLRRIMKEDARRFAQSIHNAENSESQELVNEAGELGSSGGPFWEALEEVRARTSKKAAEDLIKWKPSVQIHVRTIAQLFVPSLEELSLKFLTENASSITSLDLVPYFIRKKLTDRLCDTRAINVHILNLLLEGCPTELQLKNCSWLTDDQFHQSLGAWQTENLRVLQLDLGGQIMFDFALKDKLARFSNSFSKLAVLSLRGACRFTDTGLELLVMSAPALLSLNLGQCPLLTSKAVKCIADCLGGNLKELYIDGCEKIKGLFIVDYIKDFKVLEVFSVAGLANVTDGFIIELVNVCGGTLKDLDVADCMELTNSSIRAIASRCPGLLALNVARLFKLTDVGMEFLANGCMSIQRLNLTKTKFSDVVIAAFIEVAGGSLTELTLNYVSQVGPNTALSLAKRSRDLSYLDISWCRRISTNALGMIVDSCLSLKLLKVFGCKQIDGAFLHGHSNPLVRVVGFSLMPILDHVNLLEPEEVYLRYSPLPPPTDN